MLAWALAELCWALMNADLVPPFIGDESGRRLGMWDLFGSSLIYDDHILLTPPIQYRTGSIWLSAASPVGNWSMQIDVSIHKQNGGMFAIWLSKTFGPEQSISTTMSANDPVIVAKVEQNGTIEFVLIEPTRHAKSLHVVTSNPILNFYFAAGRAVVGIINDETKDIVDMFEFSVDMRNRFVGIQAQTDERVSEIAVQSVTFHVSDTREKWTAVNGTTRVSGDGRYLPAIVPVLRNPAFFAMRIELTELEKTRGDLSGAASSALSLITVIDELNQVSADVASFNDLNTFLKMTISPYVETWAKRSNRISACLDEARMMTTSTGETARALAADVGSMINKTITKTGCGINSLQSELEKTLRETIQIIPQEIVDECQADIIARYVFQTTILEAIVLVLVLVVMQLVAHRRDLPFLRP